MNDEQAKERQYRQGLTPPKAEFLSDEDEPNAGESLTERIRVATEGRQREEAAADQRVFTENCERFTKALRKELDVAPGEITRIDGRNTPVTTIEGMRFTLAPESDSYSAHVALLRECDHCKEDIMLPARNVWVLGISLARTALPYPHANAYCLKVKTPVPDDAVARLAQAIRDLIDEQLHSD